MPNNVLRDWRFLVAIAVVLVIICLIVTLLPRDHPPPSITINNPSDGDKIPRRITVEGSFSGNITG